MSELEALTDLGVWQSFLLRADASMRFALSECILVVTLQHHADFNWRVVTMIRSVPYNLFIIAKRAKDIKCPERLAVCKEVMSTADEKRHVIARKLKFVYKDQLVFCADNCGACRLELWLLVDFWARYCPADTQSIEGFNNIVANATVLAPNIKLPLLNARCASRSFCLGTLGANAYNLSSVKFSEMKDDLEAARYWPSLIALLRHCHPRLLRKRDPTSLILLFIRRQRTSGLLITAPCGRNTIEARTLA